LTLVLYKKGNGNLSESYTLWTPSGDGENSSKDTNNKKWWCPC
jgi:hypothetical protein